MSANAHDGSRLSGWLGAAVVGLVLLATLHSCKTVDTWEEDRSIPFSPDDRAIAYQHDGAVYVARTQGDKHRRIFESSKDVVVSTPHWAPGQRAVVFAVAVGEQDPTGGLLEYELWYWPAPQDIWTAETRGNEGDSVELPVNWRPAKPVKLLSAHCRDEMQIRADTLFAWHPDGSRVLFLDTDALNTQTVWSFDVNTGARVTAAPVGAASLAFSMAPQGDQLHVATADAAPTALWVGPVGADERAWQQIESTPGPRRVPELVLYDAGAAAGESVLYDLRPRLGVWSPDAQWLAHTRLRDEAPGEATDAGARPGFELVLTPLARDEPQRVVAVAGGRTRDLHWRPGGTNLALLSGEKLLVVDPRSGAVTTLSGVLEVERFMGWSDPGNHLAYLILAEAFDPTSALLPTGHQVVWAPAARHNLMVAEADGTVPHSRFGLMNIAAAQWGNKTEKLSFWASYLPTVSLLPPGDPAAVLDLETDRIRWYPTNIAEYAHVGHYYLLNEEFQAAAQQYGNALGKITDRDREEDPSLASWIHLWRGIARLAAANETGAAQDLDFVREHTAVPSDDDTPPDEAPAWDEAVLRDLVADRNILSTMLSMGQVQLAVDQADRIAEVDGDARRIQALCYLALVYDSVGQRHLFTDRVIQQLLPVALTSQQVPGELAEALIAYYLAAVVEPANLRQLPDRSKTNLGAMLAELAESARVSRPQQALELSSAAVVFYREAGATAAELELLSMTAKR
jgi:tetratricopeptide (TPR) repeat protein